VADRPIPEDSEQLTDEWLTSALRAAGAINDARITAHASQPVDLQGATSIVTRLTLDYDVVEPGAPRSIIAKFSTPHGPMREMANGFGLYVREIEFYRQFGTDPGIPTPRCFHAEIDPASGTFVLLLEDMRDSRGGADTPTLSIEDAEVAVRHLALFHAKWWRHPRLRELEFLRFPGSPADEAMMASVVGPLADALPAVCAVFGTAFRTPLVTATEGLITNWDAVMEKRRQSLDSVTLVHGDYHPQQLFFASERGGRFAAFDWQNVCASNGGEDLARIIVMGLSAEQRAASDGRLIELYHSLLVGHGVTGYDIEQCREDFRAGLLMTVIINVLALASVDPAWIAEYEALHGVSPAETFRWLADAVEAHDAVGAVPT
jgi:Ecdysteroid kinase-like family